MHCLKWVGSIGEICSCVNFLPQRKEEKTRGPRRIIKKVILEKKVNRREKERKQEAAENNLKGYCREKGKPQRNKRGAENIKI